MGFGCGVESVAGFGGGFFFSVCWVLVVAFRWWVSVVELNWWPTLVVGFFRCFLGFSGGVLVVGFGCGVESVAGFGGGFFWVLAGF